MRKCLVPIFFFVALLGLVATGCGSSSDDADATSGATSSTTAADAEPGSGSGSTDSSAPAEAGADELPTLTYPTTADVTELIDENLTFTSLGVGPDCAGTPGSESDCQWGPADGGSLAVPSVTVTCFTGIADGPDDFVEKTVAGVTERGQTAEEFDALGTPAVAGSTDPQGAFIELLVSGDQEGQAKTCTFFLYAPYDNNTGEYGDFDQAGALSSLAELAGRSLGQDG